MAEIRIIGAGLAGCEAAWQAANRGVNVTLCEMKPKKFTPAHHSENFAELVCSNSLRSNELSNAVGLLKEEMRRLGSLMIEAADATAVPAGSALAVDRTGFSAYITDRTSPVKPTSPKIAVYLSIGMSLAALANAAQTARSTAGSESLIPPMAFIYTSEV